MRIRTATESNAVTRPGWDAYFLGIARAVAARGDCTRAKVGAVIARGHRIVSTGYNGAPAGHPGCLEGACPRGRHYPDDRSRPVEGTISGMLTIWGDPRLCGCGNPWPCPDAAAPGEGDYSDCIALHAEVNAIVYAGRDRCQGGTIYLTRQPCPWCVKVITAAGIAECVVDISAGTV